MLEKVDAFWMHQPVTTKRSRASAPAITSLPCSQEGSRVGNPASGRRRRGRVRVRVQQYPVPCVNFGFFLIPKLIAVAHHPRCIAGICDYPWRTLLVRHWPVTCICDYPWRTLLVCHWSVTCYPWRTKCFIGTYISCGLVMQRQDVMVNTL